MRQQIFVLQDAYLFWPEWKRFIFRVLFQVFIFLGFLVSLLFILLGVKQYFYPGIFLFVFFLFILVKRHFADLPIKEHRLKRQKINLAVFFSARAKEILAEAYRLSACHNISPAVACLYALLGRQEIIKSLRYLDFTFENVKECQRKILQTSGSNKRADKEFFLNLAQKALTEARELKQESIDTYSLMLALYASEDSQLINFLNLFGIEKNDLAVSFIIYLLSRQRNVKPIQGLAEVNQASFCPKRVRVNKALTSRPTPVLDSFSVNFTELAERLKIGVMIGHLREYENLVRILSRPGKRNVLLVGPAGIGKETIIGYLAYNIVRNNVPFQLKDCHLISFSAPSLLASVQTSFEAHARLIKAVNEALVNQDIILYLPQFHDFKLLVQEGGLSAFEIFRPLIAAQQNPIIAATTTEDYHRYLEHDSNIRDSFEVIRVKEISAKEAVQILAFEALAWKKENKVQVSYRAIKRAVMLAQRFLAKIPLPSSARSLLTEAVAGARQKGNDLVQEQDIVDLVSVKTSIPLEITQAEEKERLLSLEKEIHQFLINQEEAVKIVSSALRQYRAGLANPNKPIGVFLFVGPTGVGKTELSKILARIYFGSEKAMTRFDMSEYQDQKSVFRFIGSPGGETAGVLTEAIKNNPFSLILLDEFEKAHSKVLDLFLPLFDEGRLTDNIGETINFTNTIVIATSNALSSFIKKQIENKIVFERLTSELKDKLTNYFKPELLNRFDEVVVFKPLTEEHLREITKLKLKKLAQTLEAKKIEIEFDDSVINKLAQLGYNPIFGARPLDAVIRHFIKEQLAQAILKEEIKANSKAHFIYQDNKFIFRANKT